MKNITLGLITALLFIGTNIYSQSSKEPRKEEISSKEISATEQKEVGDMVLKLGKSFEVAIFGYASKDTSCIVLKGIYVVGYRISNDTIYIPDRTATCSPTLAVLRMRIAGNLCYSKQLTSLSVGEMEKLSSLIAKLTLNDWVRKRKCSYLFSSFGVSRLYNSTASQQFEQYFGFK